MSSKFVHSFALFLQPLVLLMDMFLFCAYKNAILHTHVCTWKLVGFIDFIITWTPDVRDFTSSCPTLFLFQDPSQSTILHVVVMFPQPPLICDSFSVFRNFFLRILSCRNSNDKVQWLCYLSS